MNSSINKLTANMLTNCYVEVMRGHKIISWSLSIKGSLWLIYNIALRFEYWTKFGKKIVSVHYFYCYFFCLGFSHEQTKLSFTRKKFAQMKRYSRSCLEICVSLCMIYRSNKSQLRVLLQCFEEKLRKKISLFLTFFSLQRIDLLLYRGSTCSEK